MMRSAHDRAALARSVLELTLPSLSFGEPPAEKSESDKSAVPSAVPDTP
jgi:hypothetical protein